MVVRFLSLATIAICVVACARTGDAPKVVPQPVAEPPQKVTSVPNESRDPRIAGNWQTADGQAKYKFNKDGTFSASIRQKTRGGATTTSSHGRWSTDKDLLIIHDTKDHSVPYLFDFDGPNLTLALRNNPHHKKTLKKWGG